MLQLSSAAWKIMLACSCELISSAVYLYSGSYSFFILFQYFHGLYVPVIFGSPMSFHFMFYSLHTIFFHYNLYCYVTISCIYYLY